MDNFKIIITSRLRDDPVARFLGDLGTDISYLTLRQGEFVLSGGLGVRYMTTEQFIQSIESRSIYRDVINLKKEFSDPVIIVEGDNPGGYPGLDITSFQAAIIFTSAVNRIPIIYTRDDTETAQMLFMLTAQFGPETDTGSITDSPVGTEGGKNGSDPRRLIVESIPQISPAIAESILAHFGSLTTFFAAGIKELKRVKGIGPSRAKTIHNFMNRKNPDRKPQ